jgi:hypothetical protein
MIGVATFGANVLLCGRAATGAKSVACVHRRPTCVAMHGCALCGKALCRAPHNARAVSEHEIHYDAPEHLPQRSVTVFNRSFPFADGYPFSRVVLLSVVGAKPPLDGAWEGRSRNLTCVWFAQFCHVCGLTIHRPGARTSLREGSVLTPRKCINLTPSLTSYSLVRPDSRRPSAALRWLVRGRRDRPASDA